MILRGTVQSNSSKGPRDDRCPQYRPVHRAGRMTHHHPPRRPARPILHVHSHSARGEADALCGAGYGERSIERTDQRNGYRHRQFDARTVTMNLAIPKLRHGSYFPDWLLERRKPDERALITAVATCYLLPARCLHPADGQARRNVGITSLSKSQVSVMAKGTRRRRGSVRHPAPAVQ